MTQKRNPHLLKFLLLHLFLLSACGGSDSPASPSASTGELSAEATEYLNAALDILQENSINRFEIDWPSFRADVFERARALGGAQTKGGTYDPIRYALSKLGDGHSRFITPAEAKSPGMGLESGLQPRGVRIDDDIGYLMIPPFACSEITVCNRFADQLQDRQRSNG